MTKQQIGKILKDLRLKANMTQKEVASSIGRTQQIVGHWETGYSQPDADTLFALCDLYGASVDEAFGYTKKSPAPAETETEDLTSDKIQLLKDYDFLNAEGQQVALDYMDGLTYNPKYKKCDDSKEMA
jgi:transcriptional regulator with XRE-family HTH domain